MYLVTVLRVLISTVILKAPLLGGFLAIIADYFDLNLLTLVDPGNLNKYQQLDKTLDLYYLTLEAYVAVNFKDLWSRYTLLALFVYRVIGTIIFESTGNQFILVIFPNVFEYFFLACLIYRKIKKRELFESKFRAFSILFFLIIVKVVHEYLLHVNTTHPWTQNKYVKLILFSS